MAKSIPKGQIALPCQMCDETNEIKWKCIDCNYLMCNKCQKIHKKVKSSDTHKIVDLKDTALYSQESSKKPDFRNIQCQIHDEQYCCLFCEVCEEIVCPLCISKTHNTHKMTELSKGYDICLSQLKENNAQVEQVISRLSSDTSLLYSLKSTEKSNYEQQKSKILKQEKALSDVVRDLSNKRLNKLDQRWHKFESSIHSEEMYGKSIAKKLQDRNKSQSKALVSKDPKLVFQAVLYNRQFPLQDSKPVNRIQKRLPTFIPGDIRPSIIESAFGTLKDEAIDNVKESIFQVLEKYQTTFPFVNNIVECNNGSFWISNSNKATLHNVTFCKGIMFINHTINVMASRMALLPSGDLLLSVKDSALQILFCGQSKPERSMYSVSPLTTTPALHVTKENKIILGAKERKLGLPAKIIVMDLKGRNEMVYDLDVSNKPLFSYPYAICTDKNNHIFVIDTLSNDNRGRVVVLDQAGGVRGTYTGHQDFNNTDHPFTPMSLAVTDANNIVITDEINDMFIYLTVIYNLLNI